MTKIALLAALALAAIAPVAHAAVGDDITCKIGCWASNVPSSTDAAGTESSSALRALDLAPQTDRLA